MPKNNIIEALKFVHYLGGINKFQNSRGIDSAHRYLYKKLQMLDIDELDLIYCPPNKKTAMGFVMPKSWTPLSARFKIDNLLDLSFETNPYCLGSYSKAVPGDCFAIIDHYQNLETLVPGKYILLEHTDIPYYESDLKKNNIKGVLSDKNSKIIDNKHYRGRVELPIENNLFAFSLTKKERTKIDHAIKMKKPAYVKIFLHDESSNMNVLTSLIKGKNDQEIWIFSHTCHCANSYNDNASGVGVTFFLIQELIKNKSKLHYSIRFIWGAEFTGSTFFSDYYLREKKSNKPILCLNLDMLANEPQKSNAYLEVEIFLSKNQESFENNIQRIIDKSINFIPSTMIKAKPRIVDFKGFSDHLIFSNNCVCGNTIHIGYSHDIFNHTDGDNENNICAKSFEYSCNFCLLLVLAVSQKNILNKYECDEHCSKNTLPFNLRGMLEKNANDSINQYIRNKILEDKKNLSIINNIAIRQNQEDIDKYIQSCSDGDKEFIKKTLTFLKRNNLPEDEIEYEK